MLPAPLGSWLPAVLECKTEYLPCAPQPCKRTVPLDPQPPEVEPTPIHITLERLPRRFRSEGHNDGAH